MHPPRSLYVCMRASRIAIVAFSILQQPIVYGLQPAENDASGSPSIPYRAPYVPKALKEVLQDVPSGSNPQVLRMRELKDSLALRPNDLQNAVQLSSAYVDFGRQIGDAHYAGYAEAVISPWLKEAMPPVSVLVVHAVILQYEHQFEPARAELQRAVARDPHNQQAWLTLSFIEMTQGRYEEAQKSCQHLRGRDALSTELVCLATVKSLNGDAQSAKQILNSIGGTTKGANAALAAWILGLRAEVAGRLGESDQENGFYRDAISFAPEDDFLLVAYADFLLDQNRPKEVLSLLVNQTQSDSAFLRIALAQQALNSPQLPKYTWIMSARFEALTLRGSSLYDREHSRFVLHLLHDPQTALELAQGDWKQQRAPWDVRVFLEAALAADKPQAAAEVMAFLERTHLQDPTIEQLAAKVRAQLPAGASR